MCHEVGGVSVCEAALQSLHALPIAIASAAVFTASDLAFFKNPKVGFENKVARAEPLLRAGHQTPWRKDLGVEPAMVFATKDKLNISQTNVRKYVAPSVLGLG